MGCGVVLNGVGRSDAVLASYTGTLKSTLLVFCDFNGMDCLNEGLWLMRRVRVD